MISASEYRAELAKAPRKNKYGARKVAYDGHRFDSQKEAQRYATLKLLIRAGDYRDLKLQPRYPLHDPSMAKIGEYRADFEYVDCLTGETITEDVKSPATEANQLFQWKRRHFESEYRRKIRIT